MKLRRLTPEARAGGQTPSRLPTSGVVGGGGFPLGVAPAAPLREEELPMAEHEPLTEDECEIAFGLWLIRMAGLAGVLRPEFYPAAHELHERGWLSRRFEGDDVIWEFTDAGVLALNLNSLMQSAEGREN
jgi:hypothetical protein